MIILISSDEKNFRQNYITKTLEETPESEIIFYDDTYGNILDLEQYIFPSLFSISMPIIHLKFIINENISLITNSFIKKLVSSPTIFLFEEMLTPPSIITIFKKSGGLVYVDDRKPSANWQTKKDNNIFSVINILTNKDKKSRWLAYQKAVKEYEIEGIIGILYWKLKDLISKNKNEKEYWSSLYTKILKAHRDAWQRNVPLELTIEKVILSN